MKKYLFTLLLSTQLFGAENKANLVVGTTSGYAPFVSLDAKGNYEGFDIDFAEELSKKMNRKLSIKDCGSMPGLLVSLEQKKVDLLIWAISITQERTQKMEMIYYQGQKVTRMPLLFWKTIPEGVSSFEDLAKDPKWIVSVEIGSFQEGVLRKYQGVRASQVEKISDALLELRFGKSIAAMTDPSLVGELQTKNPELQVLELPLKEEDYSLGSGICIEKSNLPLIAEVKKATEELIAEGKVAELEKKWGLTK